MSCGIISTTEPTFDDKRVFLFDGTTIALAPEKKLQAAYPPASNQFGEGVWPIALLTVFHEVASGCALLPQAGAMYGADSVSETQLGRQGMEQLASGSIVMADAGFGIFGVAHHGAKCGHDVLLRMKKGSFESLRKKADLQSESEHHKSYRLTWLPTAKNRKTDPTLPTDA